MNRWSLAIVCTILTAASAACDSKDSTADAGASAEKPAQPTRFVSERAPYAVDLPADWRLESGDALNRHADLRANKDDRFFLIVIPQKLPQVEGVETPGVEALKEASLERMKKNVEDLEVEREGPVTLDSGDAVSVFAEGRAEGDTVQYVATYITKGAWGYQLVAWGPADAESALVDSVDRVIKGWQFRADSLPSAAPDAGSPDASEESSD